MDPGVGHQVGLELSQINIESSVKSQGGRDGGDNLTDDSIQIGVRWPLDVEVSLADVVDCLVVDLNSYFNYFEEKNILKPTMKAQSECSRVV